MSLFSRWWSLVLPFVILKSIPFMYSKIFEVHHTHIHDQIIIYMYICEFYCWLCFNKILHTCLTTMPTRPPFTHQKAWTIRVIYPSVIYHTYDHSNRCSFKIIVSLLLMQCQYQREKLYKILGQSIWLPCQSK